MHKLAIRLLFVCFIFLIFSCEKDDDRLKTVVQGTITVDSTLDDTRNYSGIGVTIVQMDTAQQRDTLYHAVTDTNGRFFGAAYFDEKGRYPLFISRRNNQIAQTSVILAHKDTVTIESTLPDFTETLEISSFEHEAMNAYNRVQRGFNRLALYSRAGKVPADTLPSEFNKWSDLFWSVYEKYQGSMAAKYAILDAMKLLEGINRGKLMDRIRTIEKDQELLGIAARVGKETVASDEGLDAALDYLDSLGTISQNPESSRLIKMERIKLLYDSARVDEARSRLAAFKKEYSEDTEAISWADDVGYDLTYLAPGDTIPDFSITTMEGGKVSRTSLKGSPYIIELSPLANSLYQSQYERMTAIYHIYKNFGLQVVTIPLDDSQIVVEAFFEERNKLWPVARAQEYMAGQMLDTFNVNRVPTRFLIDEDGQIVRKYVGNEFEDIITGLKQATNSKQEAS